MTKQEALKAFRSSFERIAYRVSYAEAFTDFLDFALYILNILRDDVDPEVPKRLDEKYGAESGKHFAELLQHWSIISDNNGKGFHDALGDLFMELVSHGKNGQFFTPEEVCEFMAEVQGQSVPGQTVCDPAVGSGRNLLAMGKRCREMVFYGMDIDVTCCKMTVLNMLVNSMVGEVAHMNTLSMQHYKSWHIKKVLDKSGHYLPYFYTTGPNQTHIARMYENTQKEAKKAVIFRDTEHMPAGDQLSLF